MRHEAIKIISFILLALLSGTAYAAEVKNTRAYQHDNRMMVEYDLDGEKASEISAVFSINGKIYTHDTLHLEGDINKDVEPGKQRRFLWNVLQDFPEGFKGDFFLKITPLNKGINESQLLPGVVKKQKLFNKIESDNLDTSENITSIHIEPSFSAFVSQFEDTVTKSYVDEIGSQKLGRMKLFCSKFKDTLATDNPIDDQAYHRLISANVTISSDDSEKYFNCILGLLDPHSSFMSSEMYRNMKADTKGSFGGLGVEITIKNGILTVVSPIEASPAFNAGIRADDQILGIDAKPTKFMNIVDAVRLMRGQKGTMVTLTIMREGFDKPKQFSLERDIIRIKSVRARLLESGYGYIRIAQFQETTDDALGNALKSLENEGKGPIPGLILDLRNDPGGLLDQAVKVADRFIDDGLIVYTHGRTRETRTQFPARRGNKEPKYPLVVLINGGSASASEIVAGALQDHKRAIVVGAQSFGKGTVQTIIPLPEESGLRLTTAKYYTPLGRSIQAKGITPDVAVETALANDDALIDFAEQFIMKSRGITDPGRLSEIASRVKADRFLKLYAGSVKAVAAILPTGNGSAATVGHGQDALPIAAPRKGAAASNAVPTPLPVISITSPDVQRSLKVIEKSSSITVIGTARGDGGIADVVVNGKPAVLDEQGNFSATLLLRVGDNTITVTAMDIHGIKAVQAFTVSRLSGGTVARAGQSVQPARGIGTGTYYALLIAVQEYGSREINRLDYPIADAQKLKNIFTKEYNFNERNITFLKNPDRKSISKAFNDLRAKLTEQDNLVIFYAGHGVWMEDMREGYWLPRDSSGANDPTDWIANSTIRNYIRALKAKHVLLVADACFSGGIFKVRDAFTSPNASIEKIYEMPSRKAITSGSLKTVPDRSVFMEYLVKRLRENRDKYLDAQKLFVSFKEAVINNSPNNQTPLYGAISEAGDEGGDFVFVRR